MADPKRTGFNLIMGNLPIGWSGTPQQLLNEIPNLLFIDVDENTSFITIGKTAPNSDQGPWLNTSLEPAEWYVWSPIEAKYIQAGVPQERLKYIVTKDTPDENIYDMWLEVDANNDPVDLRTHNGTGWSGAIDRHFTGVITMWSGADVDIPPAWALCTGGTVNGIAVPDLRDRFIVGSGSTFTTGDTGGTNGTVGGHSHGGSTGGTELTAAQNGPHIHTHIARAGFPGGTGITGSTGYGGSPDDPYATYTTSSSGNGDPHDHSISSYGGHDNKPLYYALAFIMYVGE